MPTDYKQAINQLYLDNGRIISFCRNVSRQTVFVNHWRIGGGGSGSDPK